MDRIRNRTEIYEDYWRPMEKDFGQEAYTSDFDGFMRHYLTVKTGRIPRLSEVYEAFKDHTKAMKSNEIDIRDIVKDIRKFSKFFCNIVLNQENDKELRIVFNDLKELKVDVAYPLLLELYADFEAIFLIKKIF